MLPGTLRFIFVGFIFAVQASTSRAAIRNVVTGYGADNTGSAYATEKIQTAINACRPGDTLLFPEGTYLLNDGLTLKSDDLTVMISSKALIKANTDHVWLRNRSHIIHGENLTGLTITGGGTIDGGGLVYPRGDYDRPRPGRGIQLMSCTRITVRNIRVQNIPNFAVDFENSSDIIADSVTIRGRGFANLKGSADGMDIVDCHHVTVTNCDIEVGDDALCLKSNARGRSLHDITMRNIVLASTCNAWKIGTATLGETYNILAENITVNRHSNPGTGNPVPTGDCIAAIAVESNDQNRVHDVVVRNFTINSCYSPIYFDMQNRLSGPASQMDNIRIENINCKKSVTQPILFNWQCGMASRMKDITLSNITVHNTGAMGGGNLSCMNGSYPDANKNGIANAYGLWARGVDGLKLKCLDLRDDGGSRRKKMVFDASVQNVDSSAMDDCAGVGLSRATRGRLSIHPANTSLSLFDAWGRALPGGTSDVQAFGIIFRKADGKAIGGAL